MDSIFKVALFRIQMHDKECREEYHGHVICDINIAFILEIAEWISEPHHIYVVIQDAVPEVQNLQKVLGPA